MLREPRDDSERLGESIATTSPHVYNTALYRVQQASLRVEHAVRLHTSVARLQVGPATKRM
jgi:hypothetical protein